MIEWEKYFDHIYCVHYLGYREREDEMNAELKRVGLLDSKIFSFKYTFSTPFDDVLLSSPNFNCHRTNNNLKKSSVNLAMGHYSAMCEALGLGYKRVLFIEDDIVFLKDLDKIVEILENMPYFNVCLFDKVGIDGIWQDYYTKRNINDYYAGYDILWSTGCYALDTKGMQHITKCQETFFSVADYYTNSFSPFRQGLVRDDIIRVFSKVSLAIQKPAKGENITDHGESKWVYNQKGLSSCGSDFTQYEI